MTKGLAHPRTARGSSVLLALVVLTSLLLAACSGGSSDSKSKPSPPPTSSASASASSSSATPTPTPTPAAQRAPAAPPAKPGKAGQKAFGRYVMALWGYGLRTNDPRPLVALSPRKKPCEGCKAWTTSLRQRRKQGWYVDLPALRIHKVVASKVGGNTYVRATVDIPQSDSYNRDGTFRNTNKAHNGAKFEMLLQFKNKHYQLLAFTVS